MSKKITIAIDAMGGENAPDKTIHGVSYFITNYKNVISITLSKNILRAETAAIASTTILNFNLENN